MRDLFQNMFGLHAYRVFSQTYNSLRRLVSPKIEPEEVFLSQFVKYGHIAFEIGANYGQYLRRLSPLVGNEGKVFAFEPAGITFECLKRNTRLLGITNASLHRIALSDQSGEQTLHTPVKKKGNIAIAQASLAADPDLKVLDETCKTETLDSFVFNNEIEQIDFIRCDVEGHELSVLNGAKRTIERFRPPMLIEIHPNMLTRLGHTFKEVETYCRERGYTFHVVENGRLKQITSFRESEEVMNDGNVFFIPSPKQHSPQGSQINII